MELLKCACWGVVGLMLSVQPTRGIVGGAPAVAPQPDAAVVFVQKHGYSARLEGIKDDKLGYYSFLGIRYAEPPIGQRRFQRPLRRRLTGEVTAIRNCAHCPQADSRLPGKVRGSEDCLCLNVYAPKMPGDEYGSPVVFFVHGGNYRTGSGSYYGGKHLVQKDTILVTAQYRLGSLGFLSTAQRDAAGNTGLFDMHAALEWVYDYIEFFGGNRSRVVVMGQGSGGSAASLLALSSEGRGSRGVVALSGTPLSPGAVRTDPAHHARSLADNVGCPHSPAEVFLACLRKTSVEKIIQADAKLVMDLADTEKFLQEISGRSGAGARVEDKEDYRGLPPMLSEVPAESLERHLQKIPLLTGVTSAETSRAVLGKYSQFLRDKLRNVRDFVKMELVSGLHEIIGGVYGLAPLKEVTGVLPVAEYYEALFDNTINTVNGLQQIAEATADALFNYPAYQSVSLWSKGAPAYLYTFEHLGNLTKGEHFLPGVPLAETNGNETLTQERTITGPAHGDELAYIFEPLDEEGHSVTTEVSNLDARVRDSFVSLIARFAHELSPLEMKDTSKSLLPKFSPESDPFIKIGKEITVDKNFRFCQIGLWGNMADRLSTVLCKNFIGNLLNKLPMSKLPVPDIPATVPKLPLISNVVNTTTKKSKSQSNNGPKTMKLPFGL